MTDTNQITTTDTEQQMIEVRLNKPVLSRGSRGEAVKELQRLLAHWGLFRRDRVIDGIFDVEVEAAVKTYQYRMFLKQDGLVGQLTWQSLYSGAPVNMPMLKRGDLGPYVTMLQDTLRSAGDYRGTIDSNFGSVTDAAVRSFQRRKSLVVDGIVGNRTWHALSKERQ